MTSTYLMIGGFLGAGKTTALARLGLLLQARGLRAGLITNDQSSGLVDTALLRATGLPVEEITGGCFCCRFPSLQAAAAQLAVDAAPDVYLAEPVGSCTDLVATVSYPLRRLHGDDWRIAPLSVLVDPTRAAQVLDLISGPRFSEKVRYIYLKQLEEADIVVLNKIDEADPILLDALERALITRFPHLTVHRISARTGEGVEALLDLLLHAEVRQRATMDVDYQLYAEGEALLGWVNATFDVDFGESLDATAWLCERAEAIQASVDGPVAHLKLTLDPGLPAGELAAVSLVDATSPARPRETLPQPVTGGSLVVNLRAEADPASLLAAVRTAIGSTGGESHAEAFRPSPPVPTHRDVIAATAA